MNDKINDQQRAYIFLTGGIEFDIPTSPVATVMNSHVGSKFRLFPDEANFICQTLGPGKRMVQEAGSYGDPHG